MRSVIVVVVDGVVVVVAAAAVINDFLVVVFIISVLKVYCKTAAAGVAVSVIYTAIPLTESLSIANFIKIVVIF